MRRRVVVTGVGVINPMGNDVETMWAGLKASKSGVGYTSIFDATNFRTRISAEIKNWDIGHQGEDPEKWKHRGRHTRFAAGAAIQAMRSSGALDSIQDRRRFGVYLGSGEGNQDFQTFAMMMADSLDANGQLDLVKFTRKGLETLNPLVELEQEPNMPPGHLAAMFDAQGPNANCLTACAASSQAVGEATEIIRRGEADVMLSGRRFQKATTIQPAHHAPSTASATASCLAKARRWSCWKNLSTPRNAAPGFGVRSSAMAQLPMPTASPISIQKDAVRLAACEQRLPMLT